jgi:hypothetical protein
VTSLRSLLFGEVMSGPTGELARQGEEAARRLVAAGALPARPAAANVARAVVRKVGELLDIEIGDVLVGAWRTSSALLDAARRTRAEPGTSEDVTVRTYTFGWDTESDVDVTLNRSTVAGLTFLTIAQAKVTALAVTVHNGHITGLHNGDLDLSAEVRCQISAIRTSSAGIATATRFPGSGTTLAQSSRTLDLRHELRLPATGIPLL